MLVELLTALADYKEKSLDKGFSELIRDARISVGLTQYRTAEYLKFPLPRLKLLEQGKFRIKPRENEIKRLCAFYELPEACLQIKAHQQIEKNK